MPITKSAKKALRQNVSRRKQNLKRKETYKQVVKEVRKLAKNKQKNEGQALLSKAFQALDKAAKTKVIKKNKASRLKSRISKILGK